MPEKGPIRITPEVLKAEAQRRRDTLNQDIAADTIMLVNEVIQTVFLSNHLDSTNTAMSAPKLDGNVLHLEILPLNVSDTFLHK